jgi:bacterial leucyl aminopeptidase
MNGFILLEGWGEVDKEWAIHIMNNSLIKAFFAVLGLFFALTSYAETNAQFLVAPSCLLSSGFTYEALAKDKGLYFIKTDELDRMQAAALKKLRRCRGFINVTEAWLAYAKQKNSKASTFLQRYQPSTGLSDLTRGYRVRYQSQVNSLVPSIDLTSMRKQLTTLTGFRDRHVNSSDGATAASWLKQQVDQMVAASGRQDVTVFELATPYAKQASVIMKIGSAEPGSAVVIGSPMDTLAASYNKHKPGADDGGSGVVVTLEAARLLLNSSFHFKKPLYFIWYAGAEEGLLGSQRVVQYFNQHKLVVEAVLQLDMTGYVGKNGRGIGLTDDSTDAGLTAFVADVIAAYVKEPAGVVRCGYACSDHVSWHLNGTRVAYPFETMDDQGNPYAHTRDDVMDKISFEHMKDFVKLSVAFAIELAEPLA